MHSGSIQEMGALDCFRDAVLVVEADAGLAPEDYAEPERLEAKLVAFAQARTTDNGTVHVNALASLLMLVNRAGDAVLVLEAYAGLKPADYAERERLEAKLAAFTQARETNHGTTYLRTLSNALSFVDRDRNALLVLEAYAGRAVADYDWRDVQTLCNLLRAGRAQGARGQSGRLYRLARDRYWH
jgi:hypothetical protein